MTRPKKQDKVNKYGFPVSLYVRTEADGDDTYFIADKTIAEVVNDESDPTIVAHYALVGIGQFHKTVAGEFELTTSD